AVAWNLQGQSSIPVQAVGSPLTAQIELGPDCLRQWPFLARAPAIRPHRKQLEWRFLLYLVFDPFEPAIHPSQEHFVEIDDRIWPEVEVSILLHGFVCVNPRADNYLLLANGQGGPLFLDTLIVCNQRSDVRV